MNHSAQVEIHVAHLAVVSMDAVLFLMLYVVLIIYTAVQMVIFVMFKLVCSTLFLLWILFETAFLQVFFPSSFIGIYFPEISMTLCDILST